MRPVLITRSRVVIAYCCNWFCQHQSHDGSCRSVSGSLRSTHHDPYALDLDKSPRSDSPRSTRNSGTLSLRVYSLRDRRCSAASASRMSNEPSILVSKSLPSRKDDSSCRNQRQPFGSVADKQANGITARMNNSSCQLRPGPRAVSTQRRWHVIKRVSRNSQCEYWVRLYLEYSIRP